MMALFEGQSLCQCPQAFETRKHGYIGRNGKVMAIFKYERLPDFCYVCGRLDHQELECDEVVRIKKTGGKVHREYGPWMHI